MFISWIDIKIKIVQYKNPHDKQSGTRPKLVARIMATNFGVLCQGYPVKRALSAMRKHGG